MQSCGVVAGRSRSAHGRWVMGNRQTSPPVWMPWVGGDEALGEWGVPGLRADRTQRGHGAGDARNPSVGSGRSSVGEGSAKRARLRHTPRRATRRRRWCRANAAVNGAPGRPREVEGSRHAAQSSTLGQRLPETPRSRRGYPLRSVAGVGSQQPWSRHPAIAPVRGGRTSQRLRTTANPRWGNQSPYECDKHVG